MTPHVPDPRTLRRLAGEATPGPWTHADGMVYGPKSVSVAETLNGYVTDGRYIAAASPDVVLALLDRLDALERFLADSHGRVIEDLKAPPALQESSDDR